MNRRGLGPDYRGVGAVPAEGEILMLLNIGFGNVVAVDKIVLISSYDSSPMRRYKEEKASLGKLIDVTQGRRTRSVIITTADQIILSSVAVETLVQRLKEDS